VDHWVRAGEPPLRAGEVPCPEEIEACLRIPLFAGESMCR
jgi:hypothetical protein